MNKKVTALFLVLSLFFSACGTAAPKEETKSAEMPPMADPTEVTPPISQAQSSVPAAEEPVMTDPTESAPSETQPILTQPPVSQPEITQLENTEPPVSQPLETLPAETEPEATQPPATEPPKIEELTEEAAIPNTITAIASGTKVKSNSYAAIDYSNAADGYVMVRYTEATESKLKAQVKGPVTTYTYNLTPGQWAAFPLSDENGEYQVSIYENVTGTKYAVVLSATITVSMSDEFAPFLRSNQYVNFDNAPNTVAKAKALTAGISDPLKKVEKIYDFVVGMTYDKELANTVQSGYTPNLDRVLSKMSGICFDYAALMTAMLRSQGVPAKLVIGYAGEAYHAWISVWSEQTGWVDGVIYFDGVHWKRMDPTFASSGGADMLEYIGNGNNYTAKYFY